MARQELVTVNVRNVAVGGAGVGEVISQADGDESLLGITAFVPYSTIGEVVSAQIVDKKDRYINAQLIEVEQASPDRVPPECRYFASCGGCELQHIEYEAQLRAKQEMIRGAFRSGRVSSHVLDLLKPMLPSEPYGFRRRVTLHIDSVGKVGFYRASSRAVVPIESCSVANEEINNILSFAGDFAREVSPKISSLILDSDEEGVVAVLKAPYMLSGIEQKAVLERAKKYFKNASLFVNNKEVGGFGRQILELPLTRGRTMNLRIPAGGFSQVNWDINLSLIEHVVRHAQVGYGTTVWDLYSGAGNFSLPLAHAGAKVIAVECDERLVMFGRQNAERYHFGRNLEFIEISAERFFESRKKTKPANVLVVDPPRSGLGKLVFHLPKCDRLLLISCHVPSCVRDVRNLMEDGWNLESIQPFDMFAQTSYVEILSVFRR